MTGLFQQIRFHFIFQTYLASSDSLIQAEILLFVSELIKGHVNYAMVDSNQVFLSAVIKQLSFLEEGQFRYSKHFFLPFKVELYY